MKQYCRYCCNASLIDDDLAHCNVKDIELEAPAPEDFRQQTLF